MRANLRRMRPEIHLKRMELRMVRVKRKLDRHERRAIQDSRRRLSATSMMQRISPSVLGARHASEARRSEDRAFGYVGAMPTAVIHGCVWTTHI